MPYALLPECRVHTSKMNVGFVVGGLRNEADEKAYDISGVLSHKAGLPKVNEEELWQHISHLSATPPFVYDTDNKGIIGWLRMPNINIVHFLTLDANISLNRRPMERSGIADPSRCGCQPFAKNPS
jgi:hypothetical protein